METLHTSAVQLTRTTSTSRVTAKGEWEWGARLHRSSKLETDKKREGLETDETNIIIK